MLLVILAALGGCAAQPQGGDLVLVTDDLGRTVQLPAAPQRVLTLAPSVTEVVFAAGAGDKVVGVTTADDYPPTVASLPRISALPVDFEAIVALRPDLVLASDQINSPQDAATLAAVDVPVYFMGVRSLDGVLVAIRTVGGLLGTSAVASRVADSLGASLAALRALTDSITVRPSTLLLIGDKTLYAFGRGSYTHSMISLAGGVSITEGHDTTAPILKDEYVLARRPEVIVITAGTDYEPSMLLEHHPTWDIVPALQQGRMYGVPGDYFVRPGPRLIAGAWHLAWRLHPSVVPAP